MAGLGDHIGVVARAIFGEPNKSMSSARELRFGTNGSVAIDLENGRWFDHESKTGGNVVELVETYGQVTNGGVGAWLEERGIGDAPKAATRKEIETIYSYEDEAGAVLYQTVRFKLLDSQGNALRTAEGKPRKTFQQRQPNGEGGWNWTLKGVSLVPYRLPELLEALSEDRPVYIAEGEKAVETLRGLGVAATCSPMGAGKWPESFTPIFANATVILLPDNDEAGREHVHKIGEQLSPIATVKVLELPGLPDKGDVYDWVASGGTRQALDLLTARARPWTREPYKSQYGAISFADIDRYSVPYEWLIKELLPKDEVIMIYGATMSGKSFLALDWCLAIARGAPVFGHKTRKGGVIYQAGEGGRGLLLRLKAYRAFHKIEGPLPFILIPKAIDLYHEGDTEKFIAEVKQLAADLSEPLVLIGIDTLARTMLGADENSHRDMSVILRNIQRIQEECQCAVLIIHHKNAIGDKPRGHTGLPAGIETMIDVTRDIPTGIRTLKVFKQKDAQDGLTHQFKLNPVKVGVDDDGDTINSCVIVPFETGTSWGSKPNVSQKASEVLPDRSRLALECLRWALTKHGTETGNKRIVLWKYWRDRFHSQLAGEETKTIEKALFRANTRLLMDGFMERDGEALWLGPKAARTVSKETFQETPQETFSNSGDTGWD